MVKDVMLEDEVKWLKSLKYNAPSLRKPWDGIVSPLELFSRMSQRIGHIITSSRGDGYLENIMNGRLTGVPMRERDGANAFVRWKRSELANEHDEYRRHSSVYAFHLLDNACWISGAHWICFLTGGSLRSACMSTPDYTDQYHDGGLVRPRNKCAECIRIVNLIQAAGLVRWDRFSP